MKSARGTWGLLRSSRPASASAAETLRVPFARRTYALSTDGKNITSATSLLRVGASLRKTYLRAEDAKEIEQRYLKWITPAGKDPWEYNRHILPSWKGMTGDANVAFSLIKTPERLLATFLTNMTYPSELGHNPHINTDASGPFSNKRLYHWADENVFGLPPVAVVRLAFRNSLRQREILVAEVHWWRRVLRVIKMEKVYLRDGQDSVDHVLGEVSEDDYELRKEAAEYVIPPRWLHEFKKLRWPAPPSAEELRFPDLDAEEPPPKELLPYSTQPFPHPQAAMLGRPFRAEESEQELENLDTRLDPSDETAADLAVGNIFVKTESEEDATATLPRS